MFMYKIQILIYKSNIRVKIHEFLFISIYCNLISCKKFSRYLNCIEKIRTDKLFYKSQRMNSRCLVSNKK